MSSACTPLRRHNAIASATEEQSRHRDEKLANEACGAVGRASGQPLGSVVFGRWYGYHELPEVSR